MSITGAKLNVAYMRKRASWYRTKSVHCSRCFKCLHLKGRPNKSGLCSDCSNFIRAQLKKQKEGE